MSFEYNVAEATGFTSEIKKETVASTWVFFLAEGSGLSHCEVPSGEAHVAAAWPKD